MIEASLSEPHTNELYILFVCTNLKWLFSFARDNEMQLATLHVDITLSGLAFPGTRIRK